MMNDMRTLLLATAFLTTPGVAQDPGQSQPPVVHSTPAGVQKWIRQLGSDSYRERLDAENKLRAKGKLAKKALEAAAADERDSEVQWRARRLLRQLEKKQAQSKPRLSERGLSERRLSERGLTERGRVREREKDREIVRRRSGGNPDVDDVRAEFDRVFRELERDHGIDVPRLRFFEDTFFDDIRKHMQRGMSRGLIRRDATQEQSQGMSVQVSPKGVRVEVTETGEDGESDTKVYEAPDMETFHKKHPGVLDKGRADIGLKGLGLTDPRELIDGLRLDVGKPDRGFEWQLLKPRVVPFDKAFRPPAVGQPQLELPAVPAKGRRLGIQIKEIPDALRGYLELDSQTGLMVELVQRDTLAAVLRLQPNDIVIAINGDKIGSANDVQKALGAVAKGGDVKVVFIRRGERREATATKRHDAAQGREQIAPKPRRRSRAKIR